MDVNLSSMSNLPQESYNFINNFGKNPIVLIVLAVIIILYYIVFAVLGHNNSITSSTPVFNNNNGYIVFVEAVLWGLFIILILLNGLTYFFNIDIIASIKNLFTDKPEISVKVNNIKGDLGDKKSDTKSDTKSKTKSKVTPLKYGTTPEVFNIGENEYTYEDAEALCQAYDAKLATYEQIEDAYKKGASWCNYGWSADQMVFFPTNREVWEKLQKIKGHENDCGRIGINGGYIANPNVRFGVNCYGNKPDITSRESKLMNNQTLYPKSLEDYEIDKKSEQYKKQLDKILVSPFNNTNWSVPIVKK